MSIVLTVFLPVGKHFWLRVGRKKTQKNKQNVQKTAHSELQH